MNVVQSIEKLIHDFLDFAKTELDIDVGQQPGQIVLTEVEHKVERCLVPVIGTVGRWPDRSIETFIKTLSLKYLLKLLNIARLYIMCIVLL